MRKAEIVVFVRQKLTLRDGGVFTAFAGAGRSGRIATSLGSGTPSPPATARKWGARQIENWQLIIFNFQFAGHPHPVPAPSGGVAGVSGRGDPNSLKMRLAVRSRGRRRWLGIGQLEAVAGGASVLASLSPPPTRNPGG